MDPGTLLEAPYALGGAWEPNPSSPTGKSVSIATDSKIENYRRPFTSNHRFKAHNTAECERSIFSKVHVALRKTLLKSVDGHCLFRILPAPLQIQRGDSRTCIGSGRFLPALLFYNVELASIIPASDANLDAMRQDGRETHGIFP